MHIKVNTGKTNCHFLLATSPTKKPVTKVATAAIVIQRSAGDVIERELLLLAMLELAMIAKAAIIIPTVVNIVVSKI